MQSRSLLGLSVLVTAILGFLSAAPGVAAPLEPNAGLSTQGQEDYSSSGSGPPPSGHIHYTGSYKMRINTPLKMPSLSAQGVFDAARRGAINLSTQFGGGGNDREGSGQFDVDLTFDGDRVSGSYVGVGARSTIDRGRFSGTRRGNSCYLYDSVGTPWVADCTLDSFTGNAKNLPTAPQQISIKFEAHASSISSTYRNTQSASRSPSQSVQQDGLRSSETAVSQSKYSGIPFSGIDSFALYFSKACHSPAEFVRMRSDVTRRANGAEAKLFSTMQPGRNNWQKIQTDYQLYSLYDHDACSLETKSKQCMEPRAYTAAEACDCVAGLPGETKIGPGAGELVTGSNTKVGVLACSAAAEGASNKIEKARFIAQQARAQVYTMDTSKAINWANQSIGLGYKRAEIVIAADAIREVEVLSGGFPGLTVDRANRLIGIGLTHLKAAKLAGVREVSITAQSYEQVIDSLNFNIAFTKTFEEMAKSPPRSTSQNAEFEAEWRYNNRSAGTCNGAQC